MNLKPPGKNSMQLTEEQSDTHMNIAVHFGLSSGCRHQVTTGLAFMQRHTSNINLLTFQWARELHRIGCDSSHQIGSGAHLARRWFARSLFWHQRLRPHGFSEKSPGVTTYYFRSKSILPTTYSSTVGRGLDSPWYQSIKGCAPNHVGRRKNHITPNPRTRSSRTIASEYNRFETS